jgi:hypothetical protein
MDRMNRAMDKILSVPYEEMRRRIAAEKERSAKNPHRRGPKPKATTR